MAKKITPEQKEELMKNRSLEEVKERNIPEPTITFKKGERVVYGAWDFAKILQVFDEGKYYLIYQKTKRIEYGVFKGHREEERYHAWIDLKPYRKKKDFPEIIAEDRDLRFNFSQRDMRSLIWLLYHGKRCLNLNPNYQRGNVWGHDQKIDLIDSIFKNVDIGKFVIIHNGFSGVDYYYEILDGKQRILALSEFFEGRFKYRDKSFFELHPSDQSHFMGYSISYAEARKLTDKQKYRYFLKLNKTGKPVDPNHIKKVEKLLGGITNGKNTKKRGSVRKVSMGTT